MKIPEVANCRRRKCRGDGEKLVYSFYHNNLEFHWLSLQVADVKYHLPDDRTHDYLALPKVFQSQKLPGISILPWREYLGVQ